MKKTGDCRGSVNVSAESVTVEDSSPLLGRTFRLAGAAVALSAMLILTGVVIGFSAAIGYRVFLLVAGL